MGPMVIVGVVCVCVCVCLPPLSNGGNSYGGVAAISPSIHWKTETFFYFSSLAPLFLNLPVIVFYVCLYFPPSSPLSLSFPCPASDSLLSFTLLLCLGCLSVLVYYWVRLSSSSVTAPLHILCMLYRQPNGGNQSTQMRLDSVCTLHSNQSSFKIQPTNTFFRGGLCFLFVLGDLEQIYI